VRGAHGRVLPPLGDRAGQRLKLTVWASNGQATNSRTGRTATWSRRSNDHRRVQDELVANCPTPSGADHMMTSRMSPLQPSAAPAGAGAPESWLSDHDPAVPPPKLRSINRRATAKAALLPVGDGNPVLVLMTGL